MPKTGGTTLTSLLRESGRGVIAVNSVHDAHALAESDLTAVDDNTAIVGHMPISIRDLFPKASLAVFLRDPVDRIVSAYAHVARVKEHKNHQLIENGLSLSEYASTIAPEINAQVRRLCSYPFVDCGDAAGNSWWNRHGLTLSRDALAQAQANLETMDFVGLFEEFERDARAFGRVFDVPIPDELPKLNIATNALKIDDNTRRSIMQTNALDIELYEFAKHIIRERTSAASV